MIRIVTGKLRAIGFEVRADPDAADEALGAAHVAAVPPAYDEDGQIPLDTREAVAAAAEWVFRPSAARRWRRYLRRHSLQEDLVRCRPA